jgi:hypothetical protein
MFMKKTSLPTRLPSSFYKFFWDTDAKKVNPSKHPYYVINRLLDKGDLKAVKWVRKNFSQEVIVATLKKKRDFSPWTAVFWSRFYNIPRGEMVCLEPHYLAMRRQHWPY